jgi:hypothetical protein
LTAGQKSCFAWQVLAKKSSIYSSIRSVCLTTAATEAEIGRLEKPRAFELKRLLASPRPSARLVLLTGVLIESSYCINRATELSRRRNKSRLAFKASIRRQTRASASAKSIWNTGAETNA